jgi:EAL domain-containing protein (putative c-di-GMP-specific phosphodiesterase class I)
VQASERMTEEASDLRSELAGAVSRHEIAAYYQPQFELRTDRIVSAEALARWIHPELGLVPPSTFIPLAEESGLIHEVGARMIELACTAAVDWASDGDPIEVAVNVSATQLHDQRFADRLLEIVRSVELDPALLTLEVTESIEIIDVSLVVEQLDWLRSVGMSISVDDFGTGHSSVEQVLGLRATELKIDQSIVRDESPGARTLLAAVVSFARDKGLRVVAEGIETEAQLQRIRELNCDRAQGYLLGHPLPRDEFDLLVSARNR